MEYQAVATSLIESLEAAVHSVAFYLAMISLAYTSLMFLIRKLKPCCECDTCKLYLSSGWLVHFHNLCDWYTHLLRKSASGTVQVHVLRNIITANPDNVEYILKTRFDNYPKGKPFSLILGDLLGRGIFNVDGDLWTFQRKMASLQLGSVSIRSHALDILSSEISSRLLPLLSSFSSHPDGIIDLQDVFKRFSFDNICRFSFGLDPGCLQLSLPFSEFAEAFDVASRLSAERAMTAYPIVWKIKRLMNFGTEKRLRDAIRLIDVLADDVIKQKRKMGFAGDRDLLSRFMGSIDNDRYLRDVVISFLLAGRDTVASAMSSFFWLLAQHPEVEASIREESDRVMGLEQEIATIEQMREMHYLQATVYESLRLFPPVQFDSKFALRDDVLPDGTFVKKGTRVTYHPYAMGHMERVWGPDCNEFRPERWLRDGMFTPESPFKYPVFQAGLRVCLGKEFALVEMKSVAISLIRRFDIRAAYPGRKPRFMPGLTASLQGGFPVRITERMPFQQ